MPRDKGGRLFDSRPENGEVLNMIVPYITSYILNLKLIRRVHIDCIMAQFFLMWFLSMISEYYITND